MRVFAPAGEEADPKVLAQIEMCLADERAVAGALMADHLQGLTMEPNAPPKLE